MRKFKVILSRKGFDHEAGGYPSPVLPDGSLISLPIPGEAGKHNLLRYSDLYFEKNGKLADLMESLEIRGFRSKPVHLDPDLRITSLPARLDGWTPLFGQTGAAEGHLNNNGVGIGDLFLFFGWFRKTKVENGKISFDVINDPVGKHLIFGYLEVGRILHGGDAVEKWMEYHPHAYFIRNPNRWKNAIYVASEKLSFCPNLKGAGNFFYNERSYNRLTLTRSRTRNISEWNLAPEIFSDAEITYHRVKEKTWKKDSLGCYFQSAKTHWQEAVITDQTGKVQKWATELISRLDETGCVE